MRASFCIKLHLRPALPEAIYKGDALVPVVTSDDGMYAAILVIRDPHGANAPPTCWASSPVLLQPTSGEAIHATVVSCAFAEIGCTRRPMGSI